MDDLSSIVKNAMEWHHQGRLEKAEIIYRRILEIDPSHADALHLLGLVYHAQGKYHEAVEVMGKAIIQSPQMADFHCNIAAAHLSAGHPVTAIRHASKAIELECNFGNAHYNLGNALFALGETDDAVRSFLKALETDPGNDQFWSNYLFALNFAPSAGQELIFEENRRWGISLEQGEEAIKFNNVLTPERPLRVAYYLPELDKHPTARFLNAMLKHHDRKQFEILVYGYTETGNPPPKSLFDQADCWSNIEDMSIDHVAEQMRRDRVDILLHPCTFKARYRTLISYNAAPVQIACINLVSTTGLRSTSHLVTDSFLSPLGEIEGFYTENLIRLSGFNVYQKPERAPDVAPLPATNNGYVVFGSFNNPAKITPECISLWTDLLQTIPSSRLFLKHRSFENSEICQRFSLQFRKAGISDRRLIFHGYTRDNYKYLDFYNQIDMALDPTPFGGGTTTYESTWMGVPVLTLVGDTMMTRTTGSIMTRLGYSEFVTKSPEAYVSCAKDMVLDLPRLSKIRYGLRKSANKSIFNSQLHVCELENACRDIWVNYCKNN